MISPSSLARGVRSKAAPAVLVALALLLATLVTARPVHAAGPDLLILSTTITKPAVDGNALSVEEQEAASLGLSVQIVTPAVWATMTTAQFAAYKAIVLGDPTCQLGTTAIAAAMANRTVWGPAVTGNVVVIGTDPTYHTEAGLVGARQVVNSGLKFAAMSGLGLTGAYVTLSCYYHGTAANTPVPLLDAFEPIASPGKFTATGVGCYNDAHIVATSSALTGLTDANLSNWSCSVHEAFDNWASDFVVLAIARNIGTSYKAPDGSVGTPYIIARGNITAGDITLDPATQTVCTGKLATVIATVKSGGIALPGQKVTFNVNSGPNAGVTGTGVTDASGKTSFSYTGTTAGTDTLTASFTRLGFTQTSNKVSVVWSLCEQPITAAPGKPVSATEGKSFTATVATFTDPDPAATAAEYSAKIAWGDGTASAGTISGGGTGTGTQSFTVTGTQTYAEEGSYTITVVITDIDTPSNNAATKTSATVGDASLTAKPACMSTSTVNYQGLTATFTDAASPYGTLSDFSAVISWGDSTSSAGTVSGFDGGPYAVSGVHTYSTLGPHTITTVITDVGGSTAKTSCTSIEFAFPAGGDFVVGDKSATGSVLFWGAQWAKNNVLSGGDAPRSFKGFEDSVAKPTCGSNWTTDPGNSSGPPATIPTYMAVIVSSTISKSGSTIAGDTVQMVVVKTDPGYEPNPGHAGTGTVVAVIC